MENQNLKNGKKLNKKELRSIIGGLLRCIDPATGLCTTVGVSCFERKCRTILDPPLD